MASALTPSTDINALVRRFYPSTAAITGTALSSPTTEDISKISAQIFPDTTYTDDEQQQVAQWLENAKSLALVSHDSGELKSLNTHLNSRTTILGNKPSLADVVLYTALSIQVRTWNLDQRTGEAGWHHIVRYVDFIQNASLFGLSIPENQRVHIKPEDVVFYPKPLDPKEEKERKKKQKAKAAAATPDEPGRALPTRTGPASTVEKVKDKSNELIDSIKSKTVGAAAAAGLPAQKKEKKQKQPKQPTTPAASEKSLGPNLIDLRVGHILKCERHPNADSLYVSTIDVGDIEGTKDTWIHEDTGKVVRTVCSGLNGLVPLEAMQNRRVVAVCNLKPVKMRGITSCAMVLAASPRLPEGAEDNHAGPVELVEIPEGSAAGTRIAFEGFEGEPEPQLNPKKKIWEAMQIGFTTSMDDGAVLFERERTNVLNGDKGEGKPTNSKLNVQGRGFCTVPTLKDAVVR